MWPLEVQWLHSRLDTLRQDDESVAILAAAAEELEEHPEAAAAEEHLEGIAAEDQTLKAAQNCSLDETAAWSQRGDAAIDALEQQLNSPSSPHSISSPRSCVNSDELADLESMRWMPFPTKFLQ